MFMTRSARVRSTILMHIYIHNLPRFYQQESIQQKIVRGSNESFWYNTPKLYRTYFQTTGATVTPISQILSIFQFPVYLCFGLRNVTACTCSNGKSYDLTDKTSFVPHIVKQFNIYSISRLQIWPTCSLKSSKYSQLLPRGEKHSRNSSSNNRFHYVHTLLLQYFNLFQTVNRIITYE